jgi:hypothetical protein
MLVAPILEEELDEEYPYPLLTIIIKEPPVTGTSTSASNLDKALSLLMGIKYGTINLATDNVTATVKPLVPEENLRSTEESEIHSELSQTLR